jgi:hypothetical protein
VERDCRAAVWAQRERTVFLPVHGGLHLGGFRRHPSLPAALRATRHLARWLRPLATVQLLLKQCAANPPAKPISAVFLACPAGPGLPRKTGELQRRG